MAPPAFHACSELSRSCLEAVQSKPHKVNEQARLCNSFLPKLFLLPWRIRSLRAPAIRLGLRVEAYGKYGFGQFGLWGSLGFVTFTVKGPRGFVQG